MEVSPEIYNWLLESKIIQSEIEINENNSYLLEEKTAASLENGLDFTPLIKRLNKIQNQLEREVTPMPEINSLKEVKSPASKLYNWKILSAALELLGVKVDPDSRSLIVAGDRDMVIEVLKSIYDAEKNALKKLESQDLDVQSQASKKLDGSIYKASSKSSHRKLSTKAPSRKSVQKSAKKPQNGSLYIESIKGEKPLDDCESCLEYLLVSFCKHFALRPKQAAGLLTQGGKYLSHVICKGLKGKNEPIVSWYQDIYSSLPSLIQLMSKEEASGSIPLMLASLKCGFNSKHVDTVLWCCRLFSKLGSDLLEQDMLPPAWDWFVSDTGGLEGCLQACKRFGPEIKSQVVSVLVQFARNNFFELFSIQLRNFIPDSINYLTTMNEFLPCLCEIRASKQELVAAGIVEFWLEMGIREADPDNSRPSDIRIASINFISDLWIAFPALVENKEELGTEILNVIKRGWRDKYKILKFASIGKAFHLLDVFSAERNSFAPIIYKTLTFYLVENYKDVMTREYILSNFCMIFDEVSNIPIGILLEPMLKQLQVTNDVMYNIADFDFFIKIAKHPRLNLKNAVQTIDALGKIYANEFMFIKASAIPFMMIATRFVDGSSMQEYLYRFVKYSLMLSYKYETKRKVKETEENAEFNAKLRHQRDIMLDLSQRIIKIYNETLNERIIKDLQSINQKIRTHTGNNSISMKIITGLLGDPNELLRNSTPEITMLERSFHEETLETEKIRENPEKKPPKPKKIASESSASSLKSMNIFPRGRATMEIEKIRQNAIEKEVEKRLREEKDKINHEKRRKALRKQVERRRIELGVPSKSEKENSDEPKPENTSILREITPPEREIIGYVLTRYLRVLKLLFKKYSSTGYKHSRVGKETFDTAAEKNSTLSESEFYRLFKEQGINSAMISLEEFTGLLKAFCHKQKKTQIKVNFADFQEMIVQIAVFVYSRPPKDFSHLPPAISVKCLFDYFRASSSENGVSKIFYDEPDPGVGDREIVKKLNLLLEKDPNTPLPDGYRRVVENEIEIVYQVPQELGLSESYNVAVTCLDSILAKCLGVHILQPIIEVKSITRARGVLFKPQVGPVHRSESSHSKFNSSDVSTTFKNTFHPAPPPAELILTPGIKFEIARLTGKYQNDILIESAKLVDDLLHTVDSNSVALISRNSKTKILNKAIMLKEQNINLKKSEDVNKEEKRKLRKQIIEKKLKTAKIEKEKKLKEENDKKEREEMIANQKKKKKEESRMKAKKQREKEISDWKKKKNEEDQKFKMEQEKNKLMGEEDRKKQREKFIKSVKNKVKETSDSQHEKKIEENKKIEEMSKKREEYKIIKKKQLEKKLNEENLKKEENLKQQEQFKKLKSDPKISEIFKTMQKSTEIIFINFCKSIASKDGTAPETLNFVGFNKFCSLFNIIPGLLSNEKCLKIFRTVTKSTRDGVSLQIQDFEEALLRISIESKEVLEKDLALKFTSEEEGLRGFFEYLSINSDGKQTRDLLRNIELKNKNIHPKHKKQMKNQLNKSISKDIV
jgi:hypothetical protein